MCAAAHMPLTITELVAVPPITPSDHVLSLQLHDKGIKPGLYARERKYEGRQAETRARHVGPGLFRRNSTASTKRFSQIVSCGDGRDIVSRRFGEMSGEEMCVRSVRDM